MKQKKLKKKKKKNKEKKKKKKKKKKKIKIKVNLYISRKKVICVEPDSSINFIFEYPVRIIQTSFLFLILITNPNPILIMNLLLLRSFMVCLTHIILVIAK